MLFEPSKYKHRKAFKGRVRGVSSRANILKRGSFGLKALENFRLTNKELECMMRVLNKHVKKKGKFWCNVFPSVPVTKKPNDVRMGKGKGVLDHYICRMKCGRIIFEVDGLNSEDDFRAVISAVQRKVSFKSEIVRNKIGGIID